jgi:5-methylcytosine-specific restriction endonuclease McrA
MSRAPRIVFNLDLFLQIGNRDHWTCHWCGGGFRVTDPWEIDHKTSLADGGTNHVPNLGLCHRSCNADKGTLST